MEINKEKNTVECLFIHFFFSRDKLSGLFQTCTIGLIRVTTNSELLWRRLEVLFEKSSVEIGLCFLVVSLEKLDKGNQSNNNRNKSDEDCRSSSRNVCHFY